MQSPGTFKQVESFICSPLLVPALRQSSIASVDVHRSPRRKTMKKLTKSQHDLIGVRTGWFISDDNRCCVYDSILGSGYPLENESKVRSRFVDRHLDGDAEPIQIFQRLSN